MTDDNFITAAGELTRAEMRISRDNPENVSRLKHSEPLSASLPCCRPLQGVPGSQCSQPFCHGRLVRVTLPTPAPGESVTSERAPSLNPEISIFCRTIKQIDGRARTIGREAARGQGVGTRARRNRKTGNTNAVLGE